MADSQQNSDPIISDVPASAKQFVNGDLGFFSSHPAFARKRAVWLFRLPMVLVLLGGLALLIWKGINFDIAGIIGMTQGRSWLMIAMIGVLVFLLAMAATAVLSIRASVVINPGLGNVLRERTPHGKIPVQSIVVLAVGALGAGLLFFVLPKMIPPGVLDPARAKRYALLAVLLPYILTLALFDWFTPGCKRLARWRVLFFLLLCGTVIFFVVSTRVEWALQSIAVMGLAKLPMVGQKLASLTGMAAQVFFRIMTGIMLFACVWALGEWTLSGIPQEGVQKKEPEEVKPEFLAKLRGWLKKAFRFGRRESAEGQEETHQPKPPEWFEQLCASLSAALPKFVITPPIPQPAFKIDNPSPLSGDTSLNQLFGGLTPSVDQLAAVAVFLRRNTDAKKLDAETARKGMDLLLEGENGVGKTTALMACALESLLIRGERVAVFVPDPTSRARLVALFNQALEGSATHYFFNADALSQTRAQAWLASPATFPDIIVSSPEEWEEAFFGELCDVLQHVKGNGIEDLSYRQLLKAFLRSVTTVMVDDVASPEWTAEQIAQLPFLIDKQRLLLAEAGRQLQVLATTTQLPHDAIREAVMGRLFGHDAVPKVRENFLVIRSWRSMVPPLVQVNCTAAEPVMFYLIRRGLRLKKQVLIFLPEGNARHREEKRKEFLSKMQNAWSEHPDSEGVADSALDLAPNKFRIICHLNENIGELTGHDEDRIIIYQGTVEKDMILPQLVSRYGSEKTVVFALNLLTAMRADGDTKNEPRQPMGYPLLVAREAAPLMIAHLRSAAVHLRVGSPIPRDALSMFGIRPAGLVPFQNPIQCSNWQKDPLLKLILDPEDSGTEASSTTAGGIWPMACFAPPDSEMREVRIVSEKAGLRWLFKFGASYYLDDSRQAILFGHLPDESEAARFVVWKDQKGVDINQVDLAFLDELLVGKGDERFWCRVPDWDIKGRIVFRGDPYRKLGHESVLPVWSIELVPIFEPSPRVGAAANASALGVRGPWQGSPEGVQVVELFLATKPGQIDTSTAQIPAFKARVSIKGSMSTDRSTRSRFGKAVDFSYPAAVTAVLLGVELPEEERAAAICSLLAHSWNSAANQVGGDFWPELTLALQTALKKFAPRFTHFCRLAAYRLQKEGSAGGGAVVFFIEPNGTCGTMSPMLKAILDYSEEIGNKEIVEPALEALRGCAWHGPGFVREDPLDSVQADHLIKMLSGTRFRVPLKDLHGKAHV